MIYICSWLRLVMGLCTFKACENLIAKWTDLSLCSCRAARGNNACNQAALNTRLRVSRPKKKKLRGSWHMIIISKYNVRAFVESLQTSAELTFTRTVCGAENDPDGCRMRRQV